MFRNFILLLGSLWIGYSGISKEVKPSNQPDFIENLGQWPSGFSFMTSFQGGYMWFGKNSFRANLSNPYIPHAGKHVDEKHEKNKVFSHAYELEFMGAKAESIKPISETSKTSYNFYIGKERANWANGANGYSEIGYKNLYPGIDVNLYHQAGLLKYDFLIQNPENYTKIKFRYHGLERVELVKGNLRLKTSFGDIEESIPESYQIIQGKKQMVNCWYKICNGLVSFEFPDGIAKGFPLVIDPKVVFYTYSGSTSDNWGNTAVSDKSGNSYLAGVVFGPTFPTVLGAFDRTYNGTGNNSTYDIGIQKFNAIGTTLLTSTFLGGSWAETPHSINVDQNDNLLVLGSTSSLNFPVSANAFQGVFGGGQVFSPFFTTNDQGYNYSNGSDIFITKLSASGTTLVASTYMGGSENDGIVSRNDLLYMNYGDCFRGDIVEASDGSILFASQTKSNNFPIRSAFQSQYQGQMDGVVCRLTSNLDSLIWGTYAGGNSADAFYSIQLQGNDRVVVSGGSKSVDFPITANAFQSQLVGTNQARNSFCDAVIASLSLDNGSLLHSTFAGTTAYDQAYLVQTDGPGNVYILGQTDGIFPLTPGKYGNAGGRIFVQKFDQNLENSVWSTTLGNGSAAALVPSAFLVDTCSRIYFSGWGGADNNVGPGFTNGTSSGFPTSVDAIKPVSGGNDFYFCVLSSEANGLQFGSYFGGGSRGEHVDGGTSRFDKNGIITQATCGCKASNGGFYQGTAGSYSPLIQSSNCNQGVVKINLGTLKAEFSFVSSAPSGNCGFTVPFKNNSSNGTNYTWFWGDGDSLNSNLTNVSHTFNGPGIYIVRLRAVNLSTCRGIDFFSDTIVLESQFSFEPDTTIAEYCKGETITTNLPDYPGVTRNWITRTDIINSNFVKPVIKPTAPTLYKIEYRNVRGCVQYSYYQTVLKADLDLSFKDSLVIVPCESSGKLFLKAIHNGSELLEWTYNNEKKSGPEVDFDLNGTGSFTASLLGLKNTCPFNFSKSIEIPDFKFQIKSNFKAEVVNESCSSSYIKFSNLSTNATNFKWDFGDGTNSEENSPLHYYKSKGEFEVSLLVQNQKCRETSSQKIDFVPISFPNLITNNGDGLNDFYRIDGLNQPIFLEAFNRWGEKVFSAESYQNNWKPSQPGSYFVYLRFANGESCSDWILVNN